MVQESAANEPLQVEAVGFTAPAAQALRQCWSQLPRTMLQLVPDFSHLESLVKQVSTIHHCCCLARPGCFLGIASDTKSRSSVHPVVCSIMHLLRYTIQDFAPVRAMSLQVQVLSRDIRSLHQRRSHEAGHSVHLLGIKLEYCIAHGSVQLVSSELSTDAESSTPPPHAQVSV